MASFKLYLANPKSDKASAIYVRFDDGANDTRLYLGKSVLPKNWSTEKQKVLSGEQGYSHLNNYLTQTLEWLKNAYLEMCNAGFDIKAFKEKFEDYKKGRHGKKDNGTLIEFVEGYIKNSIKKPQSLNTNKQTLALLKEYRPQLSFEQVDLVFYNGFVNWLRSKGYADNTVGRRITDLIIFLNDATEQGLNTNMAYKSKKFAPISEEIDNIYLTEAEIQKLYDYDLSKHINYQERRGNHLEQIRDLFVVGCYTGLRFSDFSELSKDNIVDNNFVVRTRKTGEKVAIPIHPLVKKIMDKYNGELPPTYANQYMNDEIKKAAKHAELDELHIISRTKGGKLNRETKPKHELIQTHTARRSFATNLYKSGFPAISIMKITGHKTEKAFMKYIKASPEQHADLLAKHWGLK